MAQEAERGAGTLLGLLRRTGRVLQRVPRERAWVPLGAWLALIWILSSNPMSAPGASAAWAWVANLTHAVLFGMLALWAALLAPRRNGWPVLDRRASLVLLSLVLAYGLLDELHQATVPGRDASLLDLLTDASGAISVLALARYAGRAEASEQGLAQRFGAGILLCGLCAALSTWLPFAFPGVGWM